MCIDHPSANLSVAQVSDQSLAGAPTASRRTSSSPSPSCARLWSLSQTVDPHPTRRHSTAKDRAITTAAKIAAGDTIRFDAAIIAALAQLEAAQLQHDTAIEVARIHAAATVEAARLTAS